ncbi:hypothetical protein BSL82_02280 [Tardibacter chloracetimidivorans]|uniref:F5/8 type C domain-containing protein n=1 Tax=Tardibacter chloracetimidivorans TaxID=1921510 RepID=A0A1L3ZRM9_9SPHN|nr:hypothetical protein [Tardibacter chloracetimidivorans]API58275.1 hypothetical protein BSL82_02280 [Tardibacter chloracetimidivorans]
MGNAIIVRPLSLGTVTAEGSATGTSPSYLDNDHIGVVHRGTGTSTAWVQLDLGAAAALNFGAFLSTNLASGATIRVRGATAAADLTTAPGYDSGVITPALAGSATPVSGRKHSWWEPAAAETFRYWRFDLASLGGTAFDAGRLVIGRKIQLARNFSYGLVRGVRDTSTADFSANGVPLIRRGRKLRTLSLLFESAYRDEAEEAILPLIELIGATEPVLVVTDPAADAQRQNRMYFGRIAGDLGVINTGPGKWRWQADLVSLI